jgi:predicted ATPase/DNA-binding winged helix-turn-helix (wHTH) protein
MMETERTAGDLGGMAEPSAQGSVILSFGRFSLSPSERLLTENGAPVELGARAFDILMELASRPNEVLGKHELLARVWPDVTVEEGSLRFHIAGLRKALGDGKDGARYIATLAGRGYCFVAPVTRAQASIGLDAPANTPTPPARFLPAHLTRMVGRKDDIGAIAADLSAARFVTIVGPGGVGKTTVAIAVAHDLLTAFDGAVLFVDLGVLSDPGMVPASVASLLGLSIQSDDPVPSLIAFLRERRLLIILDNCEHVIEEAAAFAARIFQAAAGLHILATSREALRVEGERVHRLSALGVPPDDAALTAEDTWQFPATQLFVERARASGARLAFSDAKAATVANICRKLDGMALAIELAAGRVEAYGLDQLAALLDQRFALLWPGQRTAPARQKTLQATLEWSYGLLLDSERIVFRRLAIFVGSFTIEAALAVVTSDADETAWVFAAIDSLVAKSMIMSFPTGGMMRYRLLDTARAYALHISVDGTEHAALAARHATHCLRWLEQFAADGRPLLDASQRATHLAELNNVRAALAWCFGDEGDAELGIHLAAAAAPVFFAMSLLTECQTWSQRAIAALDRTTLGGRLEMRLQAALGLSLMWTRGNSEATYAALDRSIAIAAERGDALTQMLLLTPLHVFHMRIGAFKKAMQYAEQVAGLARTAADADASAFSHILLGFSHHFAGDLNSARRALEAAFRRDPGADQKGTDFGWQTINFRGDAMAVPILVLGASAASSAMARTQWLQGDSAAAMQYVNKTLKDTADAEHPVTLLVALMYAITVLIWNGNFDEAEQQIQRFIGIAQSYTLKSYIVLGRCFEGQLAISRGHTRPGIDLLLPCLQDLRALRYELWTTSFNISLVEAFIGSGRFSEGISLIDETIERVEQNGDFCYMPELLRVKAQLLLCSPQPSPDLAEGCHADSLAWCRRQGALAWELRTSMDLARRLAALGTAAEAKALLQPVSDRFPGGANSLDLRTARGLLAEWE